MMKASISLLEPEKLPLGKMDTEAWDVLQKSLIDLKFLKKEQALDKVFTNDYIE